MHARRSAALPIAVLVALTLVASPVLPAFAVTSDTVSVRDFGAAGNGTTDDTRAFQAAADAAAGKTLSIPAGTYLLGTVVITHPTAVVGAGVASTLLKEKAGNNDTLLAVQNTDHVSFTGFALDGNLAAQTGGFPHGIQFDHSPDGLVFGVNISNCEKSAVVAYDGSDRCMVRDSVFADNENDAEFHMSSYCTAQNNDSSGTETESYTSYEQLGGPGTTHHNSFIGNRIHDAWCGVNFQRSHDNVARGNVMDGCLRGLMVHDEDSVTPRSYNNVFSGNTITGSRTESVLLSEDLSGFRFEDNTVTAGAGIGVLVLGGLAKSAFTGNVIRDNADNAIYAVSASTWTDVALEGNTLGGGLKLNADSRVAVDGNTVAGTAHWPTATSGAVVDIGSPASAGVTRWTCTASGAPGEWQAQLPAPVVPPSVPSSSTTDPVSRVAGADRYATAVAISQQNFASADTVLVATGLDYADALAAAPLAGALNAPLLLVPGTSLPDIVDAEITRLGAKKAIIAGSTAAVSATVAKALAAKGLALERIAGPTRYGTAALLAKRTLAATGQTRADTVFVTRGDAYADALGISAIAYSRRFPVLLVKPTSMPAETLSALKALAPAHAIVVGGTAAVSSGVERIVRGVVPDVTRLAGADRYATSAIVAAYAVRKSWAAAGYIGIAAGTAFADALGGAAACGKHRGVLLLTTPTGLSAETRTFLAAHASELSAVDLYGGASAVGVRVEAALRAVCAR